VVFAKIDADTGLLPIPESEHVIFECFKDGAVPTKTTKRPGEISDKDDFFKKDL
jgi:penicillin-binding protein 1A